MAGGNVMGIAECMDAALWLKLGDTSVGRVNSERSHAPAGCLYLSSCSLYFNTDFISAYDCSSSEECICVASSPPPYPPERAPWPPPPSPPARPPRRNGAIVSQEGAHDLATKATSMVPAFLTFISSEAFSYAQTIVLWCFEAFVDPDAPRSTPLRACVKFLIRGYFSTFFWLSVIMCFLLVLPGMLDIFLGSTIAGIYYVFTSLFNFFRVPCQTVLLLWVIVNQLGNTVFVCLTVEETHSFKSISGNYFAFQSEHRSPLL
jgi:hypothetical protein